MSETGPDYFSRQRRAVWRSRLLDVAETLAIVIVFLLIFLPLFII